VIEAIMKLLDFLASYPTWVKYTILVLLFGVAVLLITFKPPVKPKLGSNWKIQVYHFENWGRTLDEDKIGQRFSGLILDELLRLDLTANAADEPPPAGLIRDIIATRMPTPAKVDEEYKEKAPFISVAGFVEEEGTNEFVVHVRVSAIDSDLRILTVLVDEIKLSKTRKEMDSVAKSLAERIYQKVMEFVAQAPRAPDK
jgi:hypothetical protein